MQEVQERGAVMSEMMLLTPDTLLDTLMSRVVTLWEYIFCNIRRRCDFNSVKKRYLFFG